MTVKKARTATKGARGASSAAEAKRPLQDEVHAVLASLKQRSKKQIREEMGPRYGVHTDKAFGVSMADMKQVAKRLGRSHALAAALWDTGWYEARMVASLIDEPARVTPAQMDRWCRDFDNWGICDTACFFLFDRTPHAFAKVAQWSGRRDEFVRRAAFALLACLALHDKAAGSESFMRCLPLIEEAASDDRNFVKKSVNWALRAIGRRNAGLNAAAVAVARRLSSSPDAAARWVGRDALRELTRPRRARGDSSEA
jgi:3-methyladenine DNA glycosylase AlkD